MQQIINNVIYDTRDAKRVSGRYGSDGHYESLWTTKAGSWFLLHEGNLWNKIINGKWNIFPTTDSGAKDFLLKHMEIQVLDKYFPDSYRTA
jgi:hypothetical protein